MDVPELVPGSRAGKYRLVRPVGRGGMGSVWLAEDPELKRQVALKFLREGPLPPRVVLRFQREGAILAQLQHPNIVPVYEVGSLPRADGSALPFIAMGYVEGRTLAELIGEGRSSREALLGILEQVARAVHHCHEHGVIHRDLKPANILVDGKGRPRLVDFGLAHAELFETRLTQTQAVFGTPGYMAPEQVRGEARSVGARTDVHALGAILYEILSGRMAFAGPTAATVYEKILREDPVVPSRHAAGLAPALDAICLKALEKDPARRYPSAEALADDLARHRRGEAVAARLPSLAARIGKRAAQRKPVLVAAALGVAALAVALVVLLPRLRKGGEDLEASERLRRAEGTFSDVERELDVLRMNFYRKDYRLTPPELARHERQVARVRDQMKETGPSARGWYLIGRLGELGGDFREAEAAYAEAMRLHPGHPRTLLARGRLAVGRALVHWALSGGRGGRKREASAAAEHGIAWIDRGARAVGEDGRLEADLARAYLDVIQDRAYSSAPDLARWAGHRYSEEFLLVEVIGAPMPRKREIVENLIERMPSLPEAYFWRGLIRRAHGDLPGALSDEDLAIAINPRHVDAHFIRGNLRFDRGEARAALADYDRALEIAPGYLSIHLNRSVVRMELGDLPGAIRDCERVLELDPRALEARVNLGNAKVKLGDPAGARAEYDRALDLDPRYAEARIARAILFLQERDARAALAEAELAIRDEPRMAAAYLTRARAQELLEDPRPALEDYRQALALGSRDAEAHLGLAALLLRLGDPDGALAVCDPWLKTHPRAARAWMLRGAAQLDRKRYPEARQDFDRALELDATCVDAFVNRAACREATGDLDGALADCTRALELDPAIPGALVGRGRIRFRRGQLAEAAPDFELAIRAAPMHGEAWLWRGALRGKQGDLVGALADFDRSIELDPRVADGYLLRGNLRELRGDPAGALADFDRALEVEPRRAKARVGRGRVRLSQGEPGKAREEFDLAIEIDPFDAEALVNRGLARKMLGDLDGAISDYDRVIGIQPRQPEAHYNRGLARNAKGDLAGAAADYEEALRWAAPGWPHRAKVEQRLRALRGGK